MAVGIDPEASPKTLSDCVPIFEEGGNDAIALTIVLACD